jgi:hypothetical protein
VRGSVIDISYRMLWVGSENPLILYDLLKYHVSCLGTYSNIIIREKESLELIINKITLNSKFSLTNKRDFKLFQELIESFDE